MLENVKIFTADRYWRHILTDLGACVTDSQNMADVVFDDIKTDSFVSVKDLQRIILDSLNNSDIITDIFGQYVILPALQHKIVVSLYKKPDITMRELKDLLGVLPDVATQTVENAIYQLRKKYGRDFIQNKDGKYKIGRV